MFSRASWYHYLNEPSHKSLVSWCVYLSIAVAIVFNMVEVLLVSVELENTGQEIGSDITTRWTCLFTGIFIVDYIMRVWVAAEAPEMHGATSLKKRSTYIFSPMGMIDLFSFLPSLVLLLSPESVSHDYSFLKLLTAVRILKLTRYSASLSILATVYRENFSTLFAATIIMVILSFTAAAGIYVFERDIQSEAFGSIPKAMWWAIVTLTTVGYGDLVPVTLGGKLFGAVIMIAGVGIAAIPAGIFASSFVRLIRERDRELRVSRKRKKLSQGMKASIASIDLNSSERNEVEFLIQEYGLTLEQATSVVDHYRD